MKIIELPYEKKNDYINVITELNKSISREGMLQICINNCGTQKQLYLNYEDKGNLFKINRTIRKNHLKPIKGTAVDELLESLIVDGNDIIPLALDDNETSIQQYLS